ncbi:MAG: protein kinase [Oligoflexia bacterium]|nr:protein kinase [Oligoflexia bacterium]
MPFLKNDKPPKRLFGKGLEYEILFPFKQTADKQIFKALRKDPSTGLKQEVLVKIFLEDTKAYQEEFESLSQVSSPYCVRLFCFESFNGKKALILEYIKGVSLFQLIENFHLKQEEVSHILESIYKGLESLSQQGLCHGDLSLDNILIDETAQVKLIDFGKANYEKELKGTPPFVAPEVLKGFCPNFLSDLYSLGVIETLIKSPYPLSPLKEMKSECFISKSPLLSLDPIKRFFPYTDTLQAKNLKSLSFKVKELLSVIESRRCPTAKNLQTGPSSFQFIKFFLLLLLFHLMGAFHPQEKTYGLLKVYTNEWFILQIGNLSSYTPLKLPLRQGWHWIEWKSNRSKGKKKIFISKGKSLSLNDQHLIYR